MKIVVDSSIVIDYLRGGNKWIDFISSAEKEEETQLYLPTIVIFELYSGTSTKSAAKLREMIYFTSQFQRIDLSDTIAKIAGELFRDTKQHLGAADYIIAASALSVNAQIVTLNQKHFEKIPGINLYPVT